jgi:hypothetical protein
LSWEVVEGKPLVLTGSGDVGVVGEEATREGS